MYSYTLNQAPTPHGAGPDVWVEVGCGPVGSRFADSVSAMTLTLRQLLLILGLTLAGVGLLLGFLPTSYDGGPCGAAFFGGTTGNQEALTRSMTGGNGVAYDRACETTRTGRRALALALLLPGLALALTSAFVKGAPTRKATTD